MHEPDRAELDGGPQAGADHGGLTIALLSVTPARAQLVEPNQVGLRMGHVHLHVGSLERSEAFYHGSLGFDKTVWSYPGALFMSAGGYHHHIGLNTWDCVLIDVNAVAAIDPRDDRGDLR